MYGFPAGLFIFFIICSKKVDCVTFKQDLQLIIHQTAAANIQCSHNDSSLLLMLWYHQERASTKLTLIGYGYSTGQPSLENGFTERFKMTRQGVTSGNLTISELKLSDSAVYYCAAGTAQGTTAYFGAGTKLTVLDPDVKISYPEVQILNPRAREECQKTTVTVVCIAANFYPDHVTVAWYNDGNEITSGVATDNAATKNNSNPYYSISSRLSVLYEDWSKGSTYTCTVTFFDGKDHSKHSDSTSGLSGISYKYTARATKVAYLMFICKSLVYGLFIVFFIKRQTSK